ncbi:MAG: peptide/nickel transport system ATP-binding protein [Streptosporangiaceae bacterium]|jgi:oligopeptide/dipeptide ABC transporter ATP-binding protein|nr:peptide/nickel transport system ATP-binding protein [Streptosporangiaceae bacterium]
MSEQEGLKAPRRRAGAALNAPMLEVRDLHVRISSGRGVVRAVDGVSFEVARGEALGLVGESGSGKSMTLRAILGVLPAEARVTSGQVLLDGVDLVPLGNSALNQIRGPQMSMIFQEPMSALNPVMRVGQQIAEGPQVHLGYSRPRAMERALELMRRVGIPDPERRLRAYPHEFSGGMRQRVMIAIALSCDPEIILCDEPTTALDVTIQDQILRLLSALCRESGVSLIFVTHDLPVVAQICQRVAVMYGGQLVEEGAVREVLLDPRHPYTLGLVRSAPDFEYVRDSLVPIPGSPPSLVSPPAGCRFHPRCDFVEDDCRVSETPLRLLPGGRATACLHYERCLEAVAADRARP